MEPFDLPYNLRDGLLCFSFLIGMGAAVFLMVRKQALAGGLALAAFALFSLDPIAEVIIFRVMLPAWTGDNFDVLNWAYVCISGPVIFFGVIALIAALIIASRSTAYQRASTE